MLAQAVHKMTFGKYRGLPLSEVPLNYLIWVLQTSQKENNCFSGVKEIAEELFRRSPKTARKVLKIAPPQTPKKVSLSISEHALDRARQRLSHIYRVKCRPKESVKSWVLRVFAGVLKFGECRATYTERKGKTFKTPRYEYFYKDSIEGFEWLFVTAGTQTKQTLVTVYSTKINSTEQETSNASS